MQNFVKTTVFGFRTLFGGSGLIAIVLLATLNLGSSAQAASVLDQCKSSSRAKTIDCCMKLFPGGYLSAAVSSGHPTCRKAVRCSGSKASTRKCSIQRTYDFLDFNSERRSKGNDPT